MRRYAKALLLVFIALLYAGSANAYIVSVTGPDVAKPTDVIDIDVVLDTEGADVYGYIMQVYFDPAVLSVVGGTMHPLPGSDSSSLYLYPDNWYITDIVFAGVIGGVVQSVATLVFHVMDVPATTTTEIVPVVNSLSGTGSAQFAGLTTTVPLSIHVPEPTTTMLMGLGLLGILYAGRRR